MIAPQEIKLGPGRAEIGFSGGLPMPQKMMPYPLRPSKDMTFSA